MSTAELYRELPSLQKGQIRLLRVEPGSKAPREVQSEERLDTLTTVRCRLEVVSLSDHSPFLALSYTWGSPYADTSGLISNKKRSILCNGKHIYVQSNLYDFLLHCSQTENDVQLGPLWIDAISINQSDLPERSHQVNLMAEIYKAATRVLVWLGIEETSTPKAVALIDALANATSGEKASMHPHQVSHDASDSNSILDFDNWQALARFFERTWFGRAWIIQEVTFARDIKVLCGSQQLKWEHVVAASRFLATSSWSVYFSDLTISRPTQSSTTRLHNAPARLAAMKKTWSSTSQDGLLYALIRGRHSACQDARDKVYSQLRLGNADIFPSYKRSVAEVYIIAAKYVLEHSDNLFLLTCAEGEEFQQVPGLPSWVPDWSVTTFVGLRVTGYRSFTAAGDRRRHYELSTRDGEDILTVEATKIDNIDEMGETKGELYSFTRPETLWGLVSRLEETLVRAGRR